MNISKSLIDRVADSGLYRRDDLTKELVGRLYKLTGPLAKELEISFPEKSWDIGNLKSFSDRNENSLVVVFYPDTLNSWLKVYVQWTGIGETRYSVSGKSGSKTFVSDQRKGFPTVSILVNVIEKMTRNKDFFG